MEGGLELPGSMSFDCTCAGRMAPGVLNLENKGTPPATGAGASSDANERSARSMGNLIATEITFNDGSVSTLERFTGKVLLVVNVASACGFTAQYAGLQELYETYRAQGLEILGVPCNQFGGQEPGTDADIADFCSTTFSTGFPLAAKTDVNGDHAHPLYRRLRAYPSGEVRDVKWNFEKFLVSREGEVIGRFGSAVEPLSDELVAAVRAAL